MAPRPASVSRWLTAVRRYRPHRATLAAACVALVAAILVGVLGVLVFPHLSLNHDEGVYLRQAALLSNGKLFLHPPVADSFRPWFFVVRRAGEDAAGASLYPKYAPVPAATFALGKALVGSFRASLVLVAAANVMLVYGVGSEAFDRWTGALAAGLYAASPLFLLDSAVFLPYAPTATWTLLFALAYLRAHRRESRRYAALAGVAIGVAFFARPFTAVLFALPFVVHQVAMLWTARVDGDRTLPPALGRAGATAVFGLAGVAVALAYNAAVTGSPLVFPYEAFAPHDGVGFGHREILDYARDYTPALAVRANAEVLARLFGLWVVGGPVGTALAVAGGASALAAMRGRFDHSAFDADHARLVLLGVVPAVAVGNVIFWGNLNVLGSLAAPNDGLVSVLGPYYHFDLLLPTAVFAAHGARRVASWVGSGDRSLLTARRTLAVVVCAALVVTAPLAAVPLSKNATATRALEESYAPVEAHSFDDAVVFLPTPYGDWLGHPFQTLRNDPGYDGPTVYAAEDGVADFRVVDAFPDRTYYRYAIRGGWAPTTGRGVDGRLQHVRVVSGEAVRLNATLGIPDSADFASVRVTAAGESTYASVNGTAAQTDLGLVLTSTGARLAGENLTGAGEEVPLADAGVVRLEVYVESGGAGFSYVLALPYERLANGTVRTLTPRESVCRDPRLCDGSAAYVPGEHAPGVSVETTLRAVEAGQGTSS